MGGFTILAGICYLYCPTPWAPFPWGLLNQSRGDDVPKPAFVAPGVIKIIHAVSIRMAASMAGFRSPSTVTVRSFGTSSMSGRISAYMAEVTITQ